MSSIILNVIPSPPDERDWIAESVYRKRDLVSFPSTLDYRPLLQPIRSQWGLGTCAAQTASCMKEWQEKNDVNINEYMSPQFIYNNRSNEGEGMFGRDVMKILQTKGCCRERIFPYKRQQEGVTQEAIDDAKKFTIKSYANVATMDGLKMSLYNNGPCYISFPCFNYSTIFWKQANTDQKRLGGHAVAVVGYDKKGFILRNSWGINWGDNGYTIYPYEDFGSHWDIWTCVDEKSSTPDDNDKLKGCCFMLPYNFGVLKK
jgi:C1A family cysteine protease